MKKFKNILISGASSGIGKALAIEFSDNEINLFLTARNEERLIETKKICEKNGSKVFYKIINVKDKEELKNWINFCDENYKIDLVIANAGISSGTSFINDEEEIYNIFDTNIFGVLNTIEPLIPNMIKRKNGQIAIISSMSSFFGLSSCIAYSASKACVSSYGEALRGYLKNFNIGVSIVCPGFIKTPLTDKNKFPMPFLMPVEKASKIIKNGIEKNKGMIAFPFCIYFVLKLLKILPFSWSNFILSKLPTKQN
jgi:short-subunit dehydrogenase